MRHLSDLARAVLRFLVVWFVDGLSLLLTAAVMPAVSLNAGSTAETILAAFGAAFALGVVNVLIRPLILLLARPLGFVAVFIVGFFVNGVTLLITAWLLPSFTIGSLLSAILGGLFFAAVNTVLTNLLDIENEGSFYQAMVERQARQNMFEDDGEPLKRGLVMLEIDGLSYHHLRWAIENGRMPSMAYLMTERGYQLSRFDCGLPSQTSACQAGIMYGVNDDIPAYRWYDKEQERLYVSRDDAAEIDARFADGSGLVRGGTSIGNLLSGDAAKSLLTLSDLTGGEPAERQARAEDIYLLMLNPYFFTRTLLFFLVDVLRELAQNARQRLRGEWPRANRLKQGYPVLRAAATVLMREITTQLAVLDIVRGAPAIYVTWMGYDEVAHHSGPWSRDAMSVLETYDEVVARVLRAIERKAPRPYELILLSDHGQSGGATFQQRYGLTLKEFIEAHLPSGTSVAQALGGGPASGSLTAVSSELGNIAAQGVGGKAGRAVARRGQRLLQESAAYRGTDGDVDPRQANVTAYGSGNLAQVYFDLVPRKITLGELEDTYPGMVAALVGHEGIGLVCGYADDGTPLALGPDGMRNLVTGEVRGADPLAPYAPADPGARGYASLETRVWQVRRVMEFPHAGDLMVISSVFPDGSVAALEELIGNHGGLGGEQTDAFLFHPGDMAVPPTRSANDVYHMLNARRELPVQAPAGETAAPLPETGAWALANLLAGLASFRTWITYAAYALVLDRSAYHAVAGDMRMTGPALLLGLGVTAFSTTMRNRAGISTVTIPAALLGWLAAVAVVFAIGRSLSGRGTFTRTFRAMGFANVAYVIDGLDLLPDFAALAFLGATAVSFIATWMAAAEAHEISGRRTMVLPLSALLATIAIPLLLMVLFGDARLALETMVAQFLGSR